MKKFKLEIIMILTSLFIGFIIIVFPGKYLATYKDVVTIKYDYDDEGYFYKMENDNENLKLVSEVGGFTFKANHDGETNIVIYYLNSDDTSDYKYKFVYKFRVEEDKIYWLEGEGYGVVGYPNPS